MKILITGANGQLGQDFQKLFTKRNVVFFPTDVGSDLEDLDITNRNAIIHYVKKNKIDVIINCAAYNDVDNAEREWKIAFKINSEGVKNLALVSKKLNIELIHYSTDFVFDGSKVSPYTIEDIPNPLSQYGKSKALGEQNVMNLLKKYYLIRTSWVFGMGNVNFVNKVLSWSKKTKELRIVTDQISSPTYTVDLARTTWELINSKVYGLYHITNSGVCSKFEWAKFILKLIGWKGNLLKAKTADFNPIAMRPKFSALDNSRLKEKMGYVLPTWKDATRRFLKELGYSV
ncbi:MAG: dTDP-4-dehydrorhamnose reductase [Candidatus Heimdallarchaeaceae archaeon]